MKLVESETPGFYFGKVRSSLQRFDDQQAAIRHAKQLADVEDEPIDVFCRRRLLTKGFVVCRVHPGGEVEFF